MTKRMLLVAFVLVVATSVWIPTALSSHAEFTGVQEIIHSQHYPVLDAELYPGYRELEPNQYLDITLSVPLFNQCDSAWGSNYMGGNCSHPPTICRLGCALTSTAMTFRYFGTNTNPGTLNSCLGSYACPINFTVAANNCSQSRVRLVDQYSFSYSLLVSALENGRPPIVELTSATTHWVVVRSVQGNGLSPGDYWVNDPNGGVYRRLSYFTSNGWSLNRVVIYRRR